MISLRWVSGRLFPIAALLLLPMSGCYRDLDVKKIDCDVTDKDSCPDGYLCSAGKCIRPNAVVDSGLDDTIPPVTPDSTVIDGPATPPLDGPGLDSSPDLNSGAGIEVAVDQGGQGGDTTPGIADVAAEKAALDSQDAASPDTIEVSGDAEIHTIVELEIKTGNSKPEGITVGPDGNLWFTEYGAGKIGQISLSGVFSNEYSVPTANSGPNGIIAGPDGNLWFTDYGANQIGRMTLSGNFTGFPLPMASSSPNEIIVGPDNNLWFTENNNIGRITTEGIITEFPLLTTGISSIAITAGPDGNLWFTQNHVGKIGRITTTGIITEYNISGDSWGITKGPDGNIWYTLYNANRIGCITPTGNTTEFPLPPITGTLSGGNGPTSIVSGPDGNLWFTEYESGKIGRITTTGTVTEFPLKYANSNPNDIVKGPDGNLWFTITGNGSIGRINP
jgi:streptogramin lyase